MAILAGVIAVLHFITILTLINVTAQNLGSALFNRLHSLPVGKRHTLGIFLPIISPVPAEDLRQLYHRSSAVS
jgi:hypothetical protein